MTDRPGLKPCGCDVIILCEAHTEAQRDRPLAIPAQVAEQEGEGGKVIVHALTRSDVEALLRGDLCDFCGQTAGMMSEGSMLVWKDKTEARPRLCCSDCAHADHRPAQSLYHPRDQKVRAADCEECGAALLRGRRRDYCAHLACASYDPTNGER